MGSCAPIEAAEGVEKLAGGDRSRLGTTAHLIRSRCVFEGTRREGEDDVDDAALPLQQPAGSVRQDVCVSGAQPPGGRRAAGALPGAECGPSRSICSSSSRNLIPRSPCAELLPAAASSEPSRSSLRSEHAILRSIQTRSYSRTRSIRNGTILAACIPGHSLRTVCGTVKGSRPPGGSALSPFCRSWWCWRARAASCWSAQLCAPSWHRLSK